MTAAELVAWLRQRLDERAPTAVVRFGDGEAMVLLAERDDPESMGKAVRKLERETGRPFTPEEALEVKALLALGFDGADVLGIGYGDRLPPGLKAWMDGLAGLYADRVAAGRPTAPLIHWLLSYQLVDRLPRLLAGRRVSAISCRDLRPVLEGEWGLEDVAVYQVPSQRQARDVDGPYEAAMHGVPIWPDVHRRLCEELSVREPGEVFLVGAGIFGKDLCVRIRDRGGIALDMGSTLDRLAGKWTRGPRRWAVDLFAKGMPVAEIVAGLNRHGVRVDRETILADLEEMVDVDAWRERSLPAAYATVHLDALPIETIEGGTVRRRVCGYAFGVAADGVRDPLGFWLDDTDARFRSAALADLGRRGLPDVPIGGSDEIEDVRRRLAKAIERHGPMEKEREAALLVCLLLIRSARMPVPPRKSVDI